MKLTVNALKATTNFFLIIIELEKQKLIEHLLQNARFTYVLVTQYQSKSIRYLFEITIYSDFFIMPLKLQHENMKQRFSTPPKTSMNMQSSPP